MGVAELDSMDPNSNLHFDNTRWGHVEVDASTNPKLQHSLTVDGGMLSILVEDAMGQYNTGPN